MKHKNLIIILPASLVGDHEGCFGRIPHIFQKIMNLNSDLKEEYNNHVSRSLELKDIYVVIDVQGNLISRLRNWFRKNFLGRTVESEQKFLLNFSALARGVKSLMNENHLDGLYRSIWRDENPTNVEFEIFNHTMTMKDNLLEDLSPLFDYIIICMDLAQRINHGKTFDLFVEVPQEYARQLPRDEQLVMQGIPKGVKIRRMAAYFKKVSGMKVRAHRGIARKEAEGEKEATA